MDNNSLLWKLGLIDNEFNDKLGRASSSVSAFGSKMNLAFQAVAGSFILKFFADLANRAGQIQDTAEAFEMTTDSLQTLNFAAQQSGVSTEKLHGAFGILAGKAGELAAGSKEVAKSVEALGLKSEEFLKLPMERQLEAIAKGYANADDKGKAFASVADLIGTKNAPRLNAMLKQLGSEGLDGLAAKAKDAGQVIGKETIERLDFLGDRIAQFKNMLLNQATEGFGKFVGVFSWIGEQAAAVVNQFDGINTVMGGTEVAAAKAEAAMEKVTVALRGTAATKEELARAAEAQKKADEAQILAQLDGLGKLEHLERRIVDLYVEKTKFDAETKESLKIQAELNETILKYRQEEKKLNDEAIKKRKELVSQSQLELGQMIELIQLEELQKRNAGNLGEREKARLDQLNLIVWKKREEAEIGQLLKKQVEDGLTPAEEARLLVLVEARKETDKAIAAQDALVATINAKIAAEKAATGAVKEQVKEVYSLNAAWDNFFLKVEQVGDGNVTRLTDRQLAEKIANLERGLSASRDADPFGQWSYMNIQQEQDLARAKAERALRSEVRQRASFYGEARALQFYSAFDEERLRGYIKDTPAQEKSAQLLERLDRRLSFLFPENGAPR